MTSVVCSLSLVLFTAIILFGINIKAEVTLPLSSDSEFSFELLVTLGQAVYSGTDVNPILGATLDIEPGNFTSFSNTFHALADCTKEKAQDPINAYDPVNVRDTWFSASHYYRRADFYLHGNWTNPLINLFWKEQTAAFDTAMAATPIPGKRIQILADNFTVEAIWFPSSLKDSKRPTLIVGIGYDNAQEDIYHTLVVPGVARGWNILTYEGPGQPSVRRNQNLGFIPDWERVVSPIVDYLLKDQAQNVDPTRLALLGYSFGGYLAARAAAFEPRLSAVLLDPGVYDFHAAVVAKCPATLLELYDIGNKSAFDTGVGELLANPDSPTFLRWALEQGTWSFNLKSPFDFFEATRAYTIKDIVDRIKMPVWIANGEYDTLLPGESKLVADAFKGRATLHNFTGVAGYHCQTGANEELSRVLFAWLYQTLG